MKAHLVTAASAAIFLLNTSHAAQAKSGNTPKPAAQEFDARTGEWKPARPKPAFKKYPPSTSLTKSKTWSPQRLAMQPLRFLVMAAKVPLIPVGIVGYTLGAGFYGVEVPDFGPAFDNFDPGPAIDEDLERMKHRNDTWDERRPLPLNTRLKVASSASSTKPPGTKETAMKKTQRTTISVPFDVATAGRSPAKPPPRETAGSSQTVVVIPPAPNLDIHLRATASKISPRELGPTLGVDTDLERSGISVASAAHPGLRDEVTLTR